MTEHIKKKLEQEIQVLEHELNHELPKELKKAVAMGDLSENAEYHMAKQRQEFVRARLGQMKRRMAELSLVNMANIPKDKAAIGSTIVVFDSSKGEEIEYKLVTSEESDVTKGLISTTSPIGRALLGKKVGDISEVVTPNGKRELEVLKLVARGRANKDIARELFISENTVKNHVRNILEKLQLHSRMEAAMYAFREKILDLPD